MMMIDLDTIITSKQGITSSVEPSTLSTVAVFHCQRIGCVALSSKERSHDSGVFEESSPRSIGGKLLSMRSKQKHAFAVLCGFFFTRLFL
jgi:hypothetical protein